MVILNDEDGNSFNVELKIVDNQLVAYWEDVNDPYYINLKQDNIQIQLI